MASKKGKPNIWYRKRDITSFILPSKNVEVSGDSMMKMYARSCISAKIICI